MLASMTFLKSFAVAIGFAAACSLMACGPSLQSSGSKPRTSASPEAKAAGANSGDATSENQVEASPTPASSPTEADKKTDASVDTQASPTPAPSPAATDAKPDSGKANPGTNDTPRTQPGNQATKPDAFRPGQRVTIDQSINVYADKDGVLEAVIELPSGSVIEFDGGFEVVNIPSRESGQVIMSTTGFIHPVRIVSVPASRGIDEAKIKEINARANGLYVSATLIQELEGVTGFFKPLTEVTPSAEYLKKFEIGGRPKFNFRRMVKMRFGPSVNAPLEPVSDGDKIKYAKVFEEIIHAVNRETPVRRDLLMINRVSAHYFSREYERTGLVHTLGAWSIAVTATAKRHGFSRAPCAEFASEIIRQAYQRAGYKVADDFGAAKENQLIWTRTATVEGLAEALASAGWVVWTTDDYRPPVGAVMFNGAGETPGHVYFSAGSDGRWIVDNGSPQGRSLPSTRGSVLKMNYLSGAFALPPGITPKRWSDSERRAPAAPAAKDSGAQSPIGRPSQPSTQSTTPRQAPANRNSPAPQAQPVQSLQPLPPLPY